MVDKGYIESQYRLAVLDFRLAKDEDMRFAALRSMARLEQLASMCYGFDYADSLRDFQK